MFEKRINDNFKNELEKEIINCIKLTNLTKIDLTLDESGIPIGQEGHNNEELNYFPLQAVGYSPLTFNVYHCYLKEVELIGNVLKIHSMLDVELPKEEDDDDINVEICGVRKDTDTLIQVLDLTRRAVRIMIKNDMILND